MRRVTKGLILLCFVGCGDGGVPPDADAPAPAEKKEKGGRISLGNPKFTNKIEKFDPAAGRKVSDSKGTYSNPITGALEMYGPTLERISKMEIDRAVQFFHAENGRYPNDYEEFMTRIIKANHIKLPVLPGKMEYQYDEENHKLVVVEKAKGA